MATSNDEIADRLTAHVIGLRRVASGLAKRILELLEKAEPDLREQIVRRLEVIVNNGGIDAGPATTARLKRLERRIRDLQAPLWQEVRNDTRETLVGVAKWEVGYTAAAVSGALPVGLDFNRVTAERLTQIVTARPFQGKLLRDWMAQYESADRSRMMDQIRIGLIQDETPTQIARRLFGTRALNNRDGIREITRRGAQVLAQTSVSAISNQAREAWIKANKDVIKEEVFVATLDGRTTAICRALDGNRYPAGEGPRPPMHINCRSTRVPVMDGKIIGTRPAVGFTDKDLEGLRGPERRRRVEQLIGSVPAETTYGEFLKRQSVGFQDEVLGKTKARLFRDGGLTLDRYVDRAGNELTLAELAAREREAFIKAGLDPEDYL